MQNIFFLPPGPPSWTAPPPSLCSPICRISVVHPSDSRFASSRWNSHDMAVQQENADAQVGSSSVLKICLEAQLFKIKTQGLKICWTVAVRGALDSKVIIRFMNKFCPIQIRDNHGRLSVADADALQKNIWDRPILTFRFSPKRAGLMNAHEFLFTLLFEGNLGGSGWCLHTASGTEKSHEELMRSASVDSEMR